MVLQEHQTVFDREFAVIIEDFQVMVQLVSQAIDKSMQALRDRNIALAQEVIAEDARVNELRFKIEEACLELIATQQPIAGDLRAVVAMMHMDVEVERMGDHAAGIAKTVVRMEEEPLLKTLKKIFKMGDLSREMLADVVQAFTHKDTQRAREIAARDDEMDEMYRSVFDKLVETMARKPEMVARATYLLWCSHNLERIADRVTNVAERVIFMATGALGELNT
jgi:phosphate transport system protein